MADFRLNVTAETREAERKLAEIDKAAEKATKGRSIKVDANFIGNATQGFKDLQENLKEAANNVQTFYRVSKAIPGVGDRVREFEELARNTAQTTKEQFAFGASLKENAKAAAILSNSLEVAAGAGGRLISALAKIGFATFVLKEAVGVLQAAWTGFFNNTIGREIKLRETILKTQTTLASTNKVFKNGAEITDPYQKIVQLTSAVNKNIDSIRERSIALAGVTSNEVIEVFGIVASQVGQIGGGLKEAEDLAINFAAALGTFGIPLYQARQEIGSILRGDITMDSYLAKSLGITNEDIAKAKSQVGGVVKFLEERLAAAVAGQKIAAQGFSGVISNIADLGELIGQNFGRGLLDPLLAGLTAVFESLFRIRKQIFDIAEGAGRAIGRSAQLVVGLTAGRTGIGAGDPGKAATAANAVARKAFTELEQLAQRTVGAIARTIEALRPTALILVDAFRNVAEAFVNIKVGTFEALASVISNVASVVGALAPSLATVFNLYARFLNTDAVRYFSEVAAVLGLLKRVGLDAATQLVLFGRFIVGIVVPSIGVLGTALAGLIGVIAAVAVAVGKIVLIFGGLATALVGPAAAIPALAVGLRALAGELTSVGNQATGAGGKLGSLATGFRGLGASAKAAGLSILASLGWIAALQIGISVLVDAFGRFQRAQEDSRADARAAEALRRLSTTYKDVDDSADSATKSARDFEQQIVNTNYDKGVQELEKLREKLLEIKDLTSGYRQDAGDIVRSLAQMLNPVNFNVLQKPGDKSFADSVYRTRLEEAQKLANKLKQIDRQRDQARADDNIRLEAQNRTNLEREIGDLRRQQEDQLFQLRQQRAQKEVEIFRLAGELRIFQMEQANKKLIEGEEGASAAALDALNNYLSIRERGELDIEASKKEMTIEAANLERRISDYRLENEKKIAEIRKRAGENEQKIADYQRQSAGQIAAGSGGGAATFGSTGNVSNAKGWVHGHFQTNNGSLGDLIKDVIPVLKSLLDKGIPVELSDGTRIQGGKDDAYYTQILKKSAQQHRHSGDGRSLDLFVPEGTKVPVPLTNITGNTGRGGITGGLPGSGKSWVGHLAPGSKAGGTGPLVPPKLNNFDDIGAPAVAQYAEAVRSLSGAMERARALQAALTDAKTAAAFEEIAKAAFPKVALEQYEDQITEARISLDALAKSSGDAYDPERLRIAVDTQSRLAIQERELQQIRDKAKQTLNPAELKKLEDDLVKRKAAFVDQLQREKRLREQLLPLIRAQAAIESLRADTAAVPFELRRAAIQGLGTMAGAYGSPDDLTRARTIEAEIRIAERRIQLEQDRTKSSAEVQVELQAFAAAVRASAQVLSELDREVEQYQRSMQLIRASANTITESYKGFTKAVLTGGDIGEALTSMLESMTDRFLTMALDSAFKPLEESLVKQFQQIFNIQDPLEQLQAENTTALTSNTAALTALTAALGGGAAGTAALPDASNVFTAALSGSASIGSLNTVLSEAEKTADNLVDWNSALTYTRDATQNWGNATTEATNSLDVLGANVKQASSDIPLFQQSLGIAMTALGSVAMALASVSTLSKGGTYNTLMGIAGIFGTIASITGAIGSLGGLSGGGGSSSGSSSSGSSNWGGSGFNPEAFKLPNLLEGKAVGGPVVARRPYIVGEKGMELFVPNASGTIIPNNRLPFTNPESVSSESSGSSRPLPFTKTTDQAATARRERETINALMSPQALQIRYESQRINQVDYVTTDQFERGVSFAAERGRALALGALQNSVKTRKRVGIA